MAVLTRDQVRAIVLAEWKDVLSDVLVDGPRVFHVVDVATEFAYQESGFKTDAHGRGARDDSYGLWQINLHPTVGDRATLLRQYKVARPEDLFDPVANARAALVIYKARGGGSSWATAWKGSHAKALAALRQQFPNGSDVNDGDAIPGNTHQGGLYPGQLQVEGAVGSAVSGVAALVPALGRVLAFLLNGSNWRRIGIGLLGLVLVAGAIAIANRGLLLSATPVGKATSLAQAASAAGK